MILTSIHSPPVGRKKKKRLLLLFEADSIFKNFWFSALNKIGYEFNSYTTTVLLYFGENYGITSANKHLKKIKMILLKENNSADNRIVSHKLYKLARYREFQDYIAISSLFD